MRTKSYGNSLIEYAIPLAVFFLAGAIIAAVTDLPERFQGLMAYTMQGQITGSSLEVQPLGNSAGIPAPAAIPQPATGSGAEPPPDMAAEVRPSIDLDYPDLAGSVETSGANGTTRVLMDRLTALAEQLLDEGEITSEQAFAIRKLANQGHTIASVEAVLEQAAAMYNGDPASLGEHRVTYNGRSYTMEELGNTIGYQTGLESGPFLNDPFNTQLSEPNSNHLREFQKLFREALSSGAMNDPEVRTVITALAGDVMKLAGEVELQIDLIFESQAAPDTLRQAMISDLTHKDSQGICRSGKGWDSGRNCS